MGYDEIAAIEWAIDKLRDEYDSDLSWGVRWDVAGLPVGHIFPVSRVWDNGDVTDDVLDGTCVITSDLIDRHHNYLGTPYIVCGWYRGWGQDPGEQILQECEIMATIDWATVQPLL